MWGEQAAKVLGAVPAIIWALLAAYLVYLLRGTLPSLTDRLGSFEGFGLKLSMSAKALDDAVAMARKTTSPDLVVPEQDRKRALARADRDRKLFEGAELLWVDDRPSNNRNEARMLRGFGAMLTFAASTAEALEAIARGRDQGAPFHAIISDINRAPPDAEADAGLRMVAALHHAQVTLPVIFYVVRLRPGPAPAGAFAIINRPDALLQTVADALARTRG